MALTLDIATGRIDVGDTKRLDVEPKDADGAALSPATLTAVFTPPTGSATTYNLGDFALDSGVYSVHHTFSTAGMWTIKVTATDADGNSEVESGQVSAVS